MQGINVSEVHQYGTGNYAEFEEHQGLRNSAKR